MVEVRLIHGDCFEILPTIESESIDLVFVDPPYNIGKADWDKIDDYMDWCERWIAECLRVLKPNGAFWISHSKPLQLARLSEMVAAHGRDLINWITWDKYNAANAGQKWRMNQTKLHPQGKRSWDADAEYLIYHADEGSWNTKCDKERGFIFEPLRAYLDGERLMAGISQRQVISHLGMTGHDPHFFKAVQWKLPLENQYQKMRQLLNRNGNEYLRREYEDLRREYEGLRSEYEYLRYTFNNPGKMSSVWQIPPAKRNGHETPKPLELMQRIIETTSNEGDLVLDPMMGGGTTGVVCRNLGRHFIGIELEEKYFEMAKERISAPRQLTLAR